MSRSADSPSEAPDAKGHGGDPYCPPSEAVRQHGGAGGRLLLDALGRDVLKPAMVTDTLAAWQAEGLPAIARREGMEARPGQLKTELVHLTNALAAGHPRPPSTRRFRPGRSSGSSWSAA